MNGRSYSSSSRSRNPHQDEEPSNMDPSLFEDDLEEPPTLPPRSVSFKTSKSQSESPGIKTVGTEDTLTINHLSTTRNAEGVLGMSRCVMLLIGLLVLSSLGAGLWGWITIPRLYKQIEELEHQVDRLTGQIDRLVLEVDRFEELNAELNASIVELEVINQDFNATVNRLEGEVDQLEILNDELAFENYRYSQLNGELNETADLLSVEVNELEDQVDELKKTNALLQQLLRKLQNETDRLDQEIDNLETTVATLEDETDRLSEDVDNLNTTVANLARENDRLQELNNNLETIVGFLNETTEGISETLDTVTEYLAEQIVANKRILLENLENTYDDQRNCWRCTFGDTFRGEPFMTNLDSPIGEETGEVLSYVEEAILNEFCADRIDFEDYLERIYGLDAMSVNNLFQGVAIYTAHMLDYYFPDDPQRPGLSSDDWADAAYDCENVPPYQFGTTI